MSTSIRHPVVAGQFYPSSADVLLRSINEYTGTVEEKMKALGCIVPHAGYMYSGHVAGAVYSQLDLPKRFIILCPNHTGMGAPLSIMSEGTWLTPLGEVRIDTHLASDLKNACPLLTEDIDAHRREHAIEVQLPFLQGLTQDFSFVPIAVGTSRFEALDALGTAIADIIQRATDDILIIASSDMNHYEPDDATRIKDRRAIEPILALDPLGLWKTVTNHSISMCGFGPAVAMLTATKLLGAANAKLIKYATSGDISGDRDAVVGYAGIAIW